MEVRTLSQAITRLGFHYVRDLVTALALEHSFRPRRSSTNEVMQRIWKRSKDVAAISQILARHCTDLASEQALLAGMLHLIGALPLLAAIDEADVDEVDPDELLAMIDSRHAEVGSKILRHWRFPEFIACVPEKYRDLGREDYDEPDFADVVAVASVLSLPQKEMVREASEWSHFRPALKLGLNSAKEFYSSDTMQIDLQQSMSQLN
jgi:HD-like signal output (HDOD) protein